MYRVSLILTFIVIVSAGKHDKYDGYTLHGVRIRTLSDNALIQTLEVDYGADVWSYGSPGSKDSHVMLSPGIRDEVLDLLDANGLTHYVRLENVAKSLEADEKEIKRLTQSKGRNGQLAPYSKYARYAEIDEYMEKMAAQYPDIVTIATGGQSYEKRDIKYLKISTSKFNDPSKPIYFIEAALHAREWVTTPVALYSIHRLVEDLRDQDRDLLEEVDWIIMPLVNPDGYEYSHTTDRLWRGTRTYYPEQTGKECYGADPNRNFDAAWNTTGRISSDPCNSLYVGYEAFSEPETKTVRNVLQEYIDRIQVFLDIHSYGNWVLFPYGFNSTVPDNALELFQVASVMGAAIDAAKLAKAKYYTIGNSGLALYATSGAADDYAQLLGVPLSYCLELPDFDEYEFDVPPTYIEQINRETWEGIAASARLAKAYYKANL